ncbi:MAG: type II secretion protein F [Micavibrio sp.]|nr:type II secretion protein F [Micavibrio sp.]|tara:strand:+ start:1966 stop:2955 length:990 start_codon:yes stop_codon:yes gene_type:complete
MDPIVLVIAGIVFVAVVTVAMLIAMNREKAKTDKALSIVTGGKIQGDNRASDKDDQNKRREQIARKLKESRDEQQAEGAKKKKRTIALMMEQAGLNGSAKKYWIMSVFSLVIFMILAKLMNVSPFIFVMMCVIGFFGIPRFVLRHLTLKRQKNFLEEFPDALEAMVRLLKAGMPVSEAISMIAKEFEGPVGEEMMRVYDKQKIGVPLYEAAQEATRRMPLTEMQMFATGLTIQAQTGSSLSEVLMNLSAVIRSRFRLKRKIKALSSEAIASASIIAALPCVVTLGLWFVNPEYIGILFTDSFGKILLTGAVIWMGLGVLVMKIMINFKI